MTRRRILTLLGGAVLVPPFALRAQQKPLPVVGFLNSAAPASFANQVAGFRQGLAEAGFVEGRDVAIEYRWAEGRYERLPELAQELVRRPVAVLAATGGDVVAHAAKGATSTIPIVFAIGSDPVEIGLVKSFPRPGGNLTGISQFTGVLEAKRLELVSKMVPASKAIAVLLNPDNVNAKTQLKDVEQGARKLGLRVISLTAKSEGDFDAAYASMVKQRAGALLVGADPFFNSRRDRLVALSARHKMPTMYQWKEFAVIGGLMSYGTNLVDAYRQVGLYTGRILKGAKPGDLPVLQPTRFEFVLNAKTAKELGIRIPGDLMLAADEVIE